jgi:ferritin-like metal-binding protein YciE/gas vesicle protein
MKLESLNELFINQLRTAYSAEKQLLMALPRMEKKASHPELKQALTKHTAETKVQVNRLERIFESLGVSPDGETNKVTAAIIAEGELLMDSNSDQDVIDAGIILNGQKVEHIEMASYGTLINYANWIGEREAVQLLQATLDEEKAADKKLTIVAETVVNRDASSARDTLSYGKSSSSNTGITGQVSGMAGQMSDMLTEKSSGSTFAGILLGAAAGLAAGILMAPQSGRDSRRKITESTTNIRGQVEEKIDQLSEAARSALSKAGVMSDKGMETANAGEGQESGRRSTGSRTTAAGGSTGTAESTGNPSGLKGGTTMPPGV